MALSATLTDTIAAYTGLSPTAFFTIAVLMFMVYKTVCSMFVDPEDHKRAAAAVDNSVNLSPPPILEPVQLGDVTEDELRAYDGSDPKKPLLMAIKGQIYDVSRSRMFYGPGGPYALFAGRDASRALALLSFDPQHLTGNLEGLNESELDVLQDWEEKFKEKYMKVGCIVTHRTERDSQKDGETHQNQNQDKED